MGCDWEVERADAAPVRPDACGCVRPRARPRCRPHARYGGLPRSRSEIASRTVLWVVLHVRGRPWVVSGAEGGIRLTVMYTLVELRGLPPIQRLGQPEDDKVTESGARKSDVVAASASLGTWCVQAQAMPLSYQGSLFWG